MLLSKSLETPTPEALEVLRESQGAMGLGLAPIAIRIDPPSPSLYLGVNYKGSGLKRWGKP